ncbi:hypothetical protein P170DRAFT_233739 [Aspergillus steynii IBT 23096]|uniref:Transmembrane protein n=1 Tax=Aspergillus steynii IBT 23096 TaxID=1392250 RepID=A0A2I2G2I6_9EURO|nr:uncharacterized protein P170DRAFT_233739 [Aspergillus steynii IBT 23096]PLB47067.1 hypothetical protein P170DRAFT_233739 [Aspergillus steynii IBT 23096]
MRSGTTNSLSFLRPNPSTSRKKKKKKKDSQYCVSGRGKPGISSSTTKSIIIITITRFLFVVCVSIFSSVSLPPFPSFFFFFSFFDQLSRSLLSTAILRLRPFHHQTNPPPLFKLLFYYSFSFLFFHFSSSTRYQVGKALLLTYSSLIRGPVSVCLSRLDSLHFPGASS